MATTKRKRHITLRSISLSAFRKWLESHPRMQFTTCDGTRCPVARYTGRRVPGANRLQEKSAAVWLINFVRGVDRTHPLAVKVKISGKEALEVLMKTAYRSA